MILSVIESFIYSAAFPELFRDLFLKIRVRYTFFLFMLRTFGETFVILIASVEICLYKLIVM